MPANKLVTMANQIGTFFTSQGPSQAVDGTANYLKKFWDPRMRADIVAHLRAGGESLRPEVRLAAETGTPAAAPAPLASNGEQPNTAAMEAVAGWRRGFLRGLFGRRF